MVFCVVIGIKGFIYYVFVNVYHIFSFNSRLSLIVFAYSILVSLIFFPISTENVLFSQRQIIFLV